MARPASEYPTDLELQILKILWQRSPLPVRDVREALALQDRDLAHTSVITTLNTMVDKKYLKRTMEGNACWFAPRVRREDISQGMLDNLVSRVFDGSARDVMLSLLDHAEIDEEELRELRRLIQQKAKK